MEFLNRWKRELTPYFFYVLLISTIGPFLFGFHLSELNAPQDVITCRRRSVSSTGSSSSSSIPLPQCIPMSSFQIGLVTSIFTLGGLTGAFTAGSISSRRGRVSAMRIATVPYILGGFLTAAAPSVAVLVLGRAISGLGAGLAVVVVPIYISETAPSNEKGLFGSFTQVMINFGIFFAQLLGYFLSRGQLWRLILAAGGGIGLVMLIGLGGVVESPKWLADMGEPAAARRNLKRLRGQHFDIEREIKGWGLESSREQNEEESTLLNNDDRMSHHSNENCDYKKDLVGIFNVILHPQYNRAVIAVVMIMLGQQLCGINSIVMYGVSLLSDLLASNSALLNVFVSLLGTVATTLFAPLVDRLGRRTCLLVSTSCMGVSSFLLAVGIGQGFSILSAVSMLTFVISFAFGLGPVPFILSSELVGPEAVGATQSWALATNWIATFLVAQFFPAVNEGLGKGRVYFIFAGLAAAFWMFIAYWVPETKGRTTLEEVWGKRDRED